MAFTAMKIKIIGVIKVKTGLHIGGDTSFSAIGAIDSPVVRDPLTREPIIPGSTLKGKMRTLLARELNSEFAKTPNDDASEILRLFGGSVKKSDATREGIQQSRLVFRDAFLSEESKSELLEKISGFTETKFENTIDRLKCEAIPRQIERVVRGAKFDLEIIYNVEDPEQVEEDFANLQTAFDLLRNDYLGGGGTRGNGRVEFSDLATEVVTGYEDVKEVDVDGRPAKEVTINNDGTKITVPELQ